MSPEPARSAGEVRGRPTLKDPFQSEQTPYEILGVTRDATDADIQTGFAKGLRSQVNVQKLTKAKHILQNRNERALVDLFQYLPEYGAHLNPNVLEGPD